MTALRGTQRLGALLFFGGILVALFGRFATTSLKLFGQEMSTTSVGVSLTFIGAVMFVVSLRAILKSYQYIVDVTVKADTIEKTTPSVGVTSAPEKVDPVLVTESLRKSSTGFSVLFSVWNRATTPIKLYEVETVQHLRFITTCYLGGPRSVLRLDQESPSNLWDGKTYEIPPEQSASFELNYSVRTGPRDSGPVIYFGIVIRYHGPDVEKGAIHSDHVYQYHGGTVEGIPVPALSEERIYGRSTDTVDEIKKSIARSTGQRNRGHP